MTDAGTSKSYGVNNLNQYTTVGGVALSHGASHEMTNDGTTTYAYVGDSYLAQASLGNNVYTLYYDALGRCVKRTSVVNGGTATTNYYLFDGEHWIVEWSGWGSRDIDGKAREGSGRVSGKRTSQYDSNGANTSNALYGIGMDEVIARGVGTQGWWYFPDRNGNISVVTDGANTVREIVSLRRLWRADGDGGPRATANQQPFPLHRPGMEPDIRLLRIPRPGLQPDLGEIHERRPERVRCGGLQFVSVLQ